jgi:hypothetical protein
MCAGILGLQAIALVPVSSVLLPLTDLPTWLAVTVGVGLPVLCLLGAATMRGPRGGIVGWVAEGATIASGLATTWLFGLGLIFAALYAGCWVLGAKIDRERAEIIAHHEAQQEHRRGSAGDAEPEPLG